MGRSRSRVGVALVLDPPWSDEVQGLRMALGDASLAAIAPHLTLVPPLNLRAEDVAQAVAIVRRAAAKGAEPLHLMLGPLATFAPASPVVYLSVEHSGPAELARLAEVREAVLSGPLRRPPRWPWAPHVTICDEAVPSVLASAEAAMPSYRQEVVFDRLVLLEQVDKRWLPLADACFEPPSVIGRGGLELELTRGRELGPDGRALLGEAGWPPPLAPMIVLTGRRFEGVVGVAAAWWAGSPGAPVHIGVYVAPPARGQGVGRALLQRVEAEASSQGWALRGAQVHGPAGFFAKLSARAGYVVVADQA